MSCLVACGHDPGGGGGGDDDGAPDAASPVSPTDPLGGLPTGAEQWMKLCAKGYGDVISTRFCAGTAPPTITSLKQLETFLGLDVVPNPNRDPSLNPNVRVTLTGTSTGIGLRTVTPLNPRAFLMTPALAGGAPNPTYQIMAFARGEPLVELVANDPQANTLRFFLLRFQPACEAAGCSAADLLTPTIESGWTGYTLYDDDTIKNTTLDCLACHQEAGPGTKKILRMQELANPWAHWFYEERPANKATIDDFARAHGSEDYAGIPAVNVYPSRPFALETLVRNNGFATQPNLFDTTKIQNELAATGTSATWNALYANTVAGRAIPTPYHSIPHTDATKTASMIQAYQQTMAGTLPRDQMPDIRATIKDSALADMSIRPKPGLDGRGILVHMCQMCHNSRLDQTISRASFDVERLDQMSRTEKDEAIRRLQMPDTDARKMPPVRFHELSDAERQLAIDVLSQ
ncbi:MAG TPA: hypothetical protein VFQ53_07740 [Kofleriaceae bacterium]|nr:hypothetical protein [Kofleriaceae bacterium]